MGPAASGRANRIPRQALLRTEPRCMSAHMYATNRREQHCGNENEATHGGGRSNCLELVALRFLPMWIPSHPLSYPERPGWMGACRVRRRGHLESSDLSTFFFSALLMWPREGNVSCRRCGTVLPDMRVHGPAAYVVVSSVWSESLSQWGRIINKWAHALWRHFPRFLIGCQPSSVRRHLWKCGWYIWISILLDIL